VPTRFLPPTSAPNTDEPESSLLPTLAASEHKRAISEAQAMQDTGRSNGPTLKGAIAQAILLPTLTLKGNMLSPSMLKWAAHRRVQEKLLPTLSASTYGSNQGGAAGRVGPVRKSLRGLVGGSLSPQWCEHFMGFQKDWTALHETNEPSTEPTEPETDSENGL
jgi:hypothetical protein